VADVEAAARAAEAAASAMQMPIIAHVIANPSEQARAAYEAGQDFSP